MNGVIRIVTDADALAADAAELFVTAAGEAVRDGGEFVVCLAGGTTPRGLYARLAAAPFRQRVPWERTRFFWGDERRVPPDHADSNYRMVREILLSRVNVPPDRIHRIEAELPDPAVAAASYERTLRESRGTGPTPLFDLVLLGLGADGHTASLFPRTEGLREKTRLVVAHRVESLGMSRITMTVPALCSAARVLFLVSGPDKARALRAVMNCEAPDASLPASFIRPSAGRLTWLVDREAARLLAGPG